MKTRFWLTIAVSLVTSCLAAAIAEVRLIDTIAVSASGTTLGEIAILNTSDAALKARLAAIKVAPAPSIVNARVVTAHAVKEALGLAGLGKDVEVVGAQVIVSLATRVVPEDELTALLKGYVDDALNPDTVADVTVLRLPAAWKIPSGEEVKIALDGLNRKVAGTQVVTLRATYGDQTFATGQARIRVVLHQNRWVLTRALDRKEILTPDACEMRSVEVPGMEVADSHEVIGLAAKHNLTAGTVISTKDFERPTCIERGSLGRIIIINNEVRMQVSGAQALQSGKVGELILFKNPMNPREPIKAKVVSAGVAILDLGHMNQEDYR